jgi:hypothetical protein
LIRSVTDSVARGEDAPAFAARIGCGKGVAGYVYQTVPAALHVWLAHQNDYRAAIVSVIRLGGDTDTTAAMPLNPLKLLARNLVFMLIVLAHGFRRLLPPY